MPRLIRGDICAYRRNLLGYSRWKIPKSSCYHSEQLGNVEVPSSFTGPTCLLQQPTDRFGINMNQEGLEERKVRVIVENGEQDGHQCAYLEQMLNLWQLSLRVARQTLHLKILDLI